MTGDDRDRPGPEGDANVGVVTALPTPPVAADSAAAATTTTAIVAAAATTNAA